LCGGMIVVVKCVFKSGELAWFGAVTDPYLVHEVTIVPSPKMLPVRQCDGRRRMRSAAVLTEL